MNVYVVSRPTGCVGSTEIHDYLIEDKEGHILATATTHGEALAWAQERGYQALIERRQGRHDKNNPEHRREG
jgi:hypothetical protein